MVTWRPLNRKFKWLLASLLAVKWPLAFHMRFAWLMVDAKFFALTFGWCEMVFADVKWRLLMQNWNFWCEMVTRKFSHWELAVWSWCEIFRIENWQCENFRSEKRWYEIFRIEFTLRMAIAKFFALSSHWEWPMRKFSYWLFGLAKCSIFLCFWLPLFWSSKI